MQLVEVFELSLTSTRVLHRIKFVNRKLQPLHLLISKKEYGIGLQEYKMTNMDVFSPTLYFSFKKEAVGGFSRCFSRSSYNANVNKDEGRFDLPYDFDTLYHISKYLFELFFIPSITLSIECTKITAELFSHPLFAACFFIEVINEKTNVITNRQVSNILKHANPIHGIAITCQVSSNFKEHKSLLNFPCIEVVYGKWITFDTLLNASAGKILIGTHNFTERHLKIFIKYWLKKDNQTFYRLRLEKFDREPDWEEMLEGIEYTKWDENRRSRAFCTTTSCAHWMLDCVDGWDFERKDGKLATVLQNSLYFNMVVWHDRFPTMH